MLFVFVSYQKKIQMIKSFFGYMNWIYLFIFVTKDINVDLILLFYLIVIIDLTGNAMLE